MPLLRFDVSVHTDGKERVIHKTESLPSAAYKDDVSVNRIAWHWHEEFELLHLLDGNIEFLIGTTQFSLKGGEALFINTQVLHGAWDNHDASCPYHSVVFHPLLVGGGETSIFMRKYINPILLNPSLPYMIFRPDRSWQSGVIDQIENVWSEIRSHEEGYEFAVRSGLSNCILEICRHGNDYMSPPSEKQLREQERVKKMLLYIEEHLADDITIRDIAAAAYISNTECMRCFKGILHTTPIQYLKQIRLRRAEKLLTSTNLRVEEIGLRCSFTEMSYFARSFRKEYGVNPLAYRKGKFPRHVHTSE